MKVSITYKNNAKDNVRVSVTFDDIWNGDVTLARVIFPILKKYRKQYDKKNSWAGCPAEFAPDPLKPEGPDNPDRLHEWIECLDKMIYSFEWIAKQHDWDGPEAKEFYKRWRELEKKYSKELKKLAREDDKIRKSRLYRAREPLERNRSAEIMQPLFEEYNKKFQEHHKKIQEGINLFAKHFASFWL